MATPPIVNIEEVTLAEQFRGPKGFPEAMPEKAMGIMTARLGPLLGAERLGCSLAVVPPGKTMFPYHLHHANEEMFVVLSGHGTLRHDGEEYPIRQGDVIAAPTGSSHQIQNTSDAELRYLSISTMIWPEVCEYPDSGKIAAIPGPGGGGVHISRRDDIKPYWSGETLD